MAKLLAVLITAILFKNSHQHLPSFGHLPEERVSPPACDTSTHGTSYCLNCEASQFCLYNGLPTMFTTPCTGSTPVCGLDTSNPPQYACVASNAGCTCPGTAGLSYMQDPYNSHYYTVCSGTDRISINCENMYYNPDRNDCSGTEAPPPPTTPTPPTTPPPICPGSGVYEDADRATCNGYVVCSSSQQVISSSTCTPPLNYFNSTTRTCTSPISPFRCQTGYVGYYADPFDCQRYYVCNGNTLVLSACCSGIQNWDNAAQGCVDNAPCDELPPCASDGATTPAPATTPSTSTPTTTSSTSTPTTTSSTSTPTTTSSTSTPTTTSSTSTPSTTSSTSTPSTTSSTSTPSTTSSTSTPPTTTRTSTTTISQGCTPLANFICPAPDGYFPQCNYCARTYFQCVAGTATLRSCSGTLLFNTVPSYPACLSTCPYYP